MLDTITRKTAKNVKKCKGDIIKELQHVETEYRKRFREMEAKNKALETENRQLHHEIKRLKSMVEEPAAKSSCQPQMLQPLGFMNRIPSISCNPQFSFPSMHFEHLTPEPLMLEMPRSESARHFCDEIAYESAQGMGPLLSVMNQKTVDYDLIRELIEPEGGAAAHDWPGAHPSMTSMNQPVVKTEFML